MTKYDEVKVGMLVRHAKGFIGRVESAVDDEITIKVTEPNGTKYPKGLLYKGLVEFVTIISTDADTSINDSYEVEFEFNGLIVRTDYKYFIQFIKDMSK